MNGTQSINSRLVGLEERRVEHSSCWRIGDQLLHASGESFERFVADADRQPRIRAELSHAERD
jgi:hypothetical protein